MTEFRMMISSSLPSVHLAAASESLSESWRHRLISEPFRPFFLLGWIASLIGLLLWPLFFSGAIERYPGFSHAYLMVQFFMGPFAVGFLWTALPRMLEVPGPGRLFVLSGAGLIIAGMIFHLTGHHPAGHFAFIGLIGLVIAFVAKRFPARRDLPPPSFLFVASGMILALIGSLLTAAGEAGWIGGFGYRTGRIFLTEYFLLFLVVGVSAFLAPRFLQQKARQGFADGRKAPPLWKKRAGFAAATVLILTTGAIIEAAGNVRTGALITAIPLSIYVLYHVRIWKKQPDWTWLSVGVRIALLSTIASPWFRVLFPEARLLTAHLLLLGGFGLLTLVVGARVTFGHSGYESLFRKKVHLIGLVVGLYVISLLTRIAGELFSAEWKPFLLFSASLLILAHLVWAFVALPKLLRPLPDEDDQIEKTIQQLKKGRN